MLIRLSNPSGLAVPLDQLKLALRVDTDDDDTRLATLIRAETMRYEDFTGRLMLPIDCDYQFERWTDPLCIPVTPIRFVVSVAYLNASNIETTLDAGDWYEVTSDEGVEIRFTDAFDSPPLSDREYPVRVTFQAGYDEEGVSGSGDDPELAPVKQDQVNITRMVQRIYDLDEVMKDDEMRWAMGNRRIFR